MAGKIVLKGNPEISDYRLTGAARPGHLVELTGNSDQCQLAQTANGARAVRVVLPSGKVGVDGSYANGDVVPVATLSIGDVAAVRASAGSQAAYSRGVPLAAGHNPAANQGRANGAGTMHTMEVYAQPDGAVAADGFVHVQVVD